MEKVLLSVHVLAAVLVVGPVTVAASLFPRTVRDAARSGDAPARAPLLLHRITAGYAVVGVAVPVFGVATAVGLGVLTEMWLLVAMVLTALAAVVLGAVVVPGQRRVLAGLAQAAPPERDLVRLSLVTGVFSLLWAIVVVLMIVRPGSTTGV